MFCTKCGAQIEGNDKFCTQCGTPVGAGASAASSAAAQETAPAAGATAVMPAQGAPVASAAPQQAASVPATAPAPAAAPAAATYATPAPAPAVPVTSSVALDAAAAAPAQASGGNRGMVIALIIAAAALLAAVAAFLLVNSGMIGGPSSYSVSYETGGGSTLAASQVDVGGSLTSPADPVKDGYVFEGWYADAACTQRVTFPYAPEGNTVLYAKWEEAPASPESEKADSSNGAKGEAGGNTTIIVNPGTTSGSTTTQQPATTTNSSNVTVSIVGADGTTRTETIRRQGNSERVFPDSNTRRLSTSEVAALTDAERCIAWNEIIAASNGYMFKNSGLASYFNSCSWYHPVQGAGGGGSLTSEASDNVNLLKSYTSDWWQHLATN